MNEYKLRKDYHNISKSVIDKVANIIKDGDITDPKHKDTINEYMRAVDYNYCNILCEFISSLFNVDRAEVLSCDKRSDITHARWMYWNTLYYMFKKSYREIAIISSLEGETKDVSTVHKGIESLGYEMKTDILLKDKWNIIQQFVFIGKHPNAYDTPFSDIISKPINITVHKPKNVNVTIIDNND